jgi:hypothetical protein
MYPPTIPIAAVMVYSSRDHGVTVIWVFGSNEAYEASGEDAEGDVP